MNWNNYEGWKMAKKKKSTNAKAKDKYTIEPTRSTFAVFYEGEKIQSCASLEDAENFVRDRKAGLV